MYFIIKGYGDGGFFHTVAELGEVVTVENGLMSSGAGATIQILEIVNSAEEAARKLELWKSGALTLSAS